MEFVIVSVLLACILAYLSWRFLRASSQLGASAPSVSAASEPLKMSERAGAQTLGTKLTPTTEINEPDSSKQSQRTDSDDSFQIVNRPTESDLMNEAVEQPSRIVTPDPQKNSLFSRFTDTLRRRSFPDPSKPFPAVNSVPSLEPACRDTSLEDKTNCEETNCEETNCEETNCEETNCGENNCGETNCGEKAASAVEDSEAAAELRCDDEGRASDGSADAEIPSRAPEEADESDGAEGSAQEQALMRQRRLEWLRQSIVASALEMRRGERRKQKRAAGRLEGRREGTEPPTAQEVPTDEDSSGDENETEESMSDEDFEPDVGAAEALKAQGNEAYKNGNCEAAIRLYTEALLKCPCTDGDELAAMLLCNRAACNLSQKRFEDVVTDCTNALEFDNSYTKAYLRRFRAYKELGKLHDALADINKALELDSSLKSSYYGVQKEVEKLSQEQFEKEKAELVDKLKTFGDWALGKVGLSLNNFKLEQNADTGAYNIQFVQGAQPNSSVST